MNFQLFTDYPSWFWLLCVVCGGVYAVGMYFREKKIGSAISAVWWKRVLAGLRFFAVFILAFLLLNPFLKSRSNQTEQPIIILAQDNSSSVAMGISDTVPYKNLLADLQKSLEDKFDVRSYTFGESLKEGIDVMHFQEKSTDLSSALSELNNLYQNLNVGAIIIASDGIYNTGSNPIYVKNDLGSPIYSIALGDTVQKKDIRITRVLHNNIVYLKDKFNVITELEAIYCGGTNPKISISEVTKGTVKVLGEKNISINGDQFNSNVSWEISADVPGIRHYQVRIQSVEGENTTDNNVQDIYIEVLDARQKILLLANSPHPDINAIKQSIESNQNYEVEIQLAGEIKGNIGEYDLVILHQLPSSKYQIPDVLNSLKSKNIPLWVITGSQTSMSAFNKMQNLVTINSSGQSANEVTATLDNGFNLFTLNDKSVSVFPKLPALNAPYGQYTVSPASQVILFQKIGSVNTKNPLLVYSLPASEKYAIFLGENIWKWRLYDYVLNTNQDATNELISKTIQYLVAKNDKKQFRVSQAKNVLNESESVILDAELYNDSYELVNEPDATVVIKNEDGKDFPFQFSKTTKSYSLDAGYFPSGNYTYDAKVVYNGKEFKDNGAFSISPIRLETINTTANHSLLNQLAVQSGGQMVYADQLEKLITTIEQSSSAKPVMRETIKTQSIINLKWIFFLILGLLGVEWFVRKFNGGY